MAARVALVPPLLGCVLIAALAVLHEGAFRAVVREDSVLEWAQVGAYAFAVIAATGVAHRTGGVVRVAYAGFALAAVAAIGEEISWGQRLFDLAARAR